MKLFFLATLLWVYAVDPLNAFGPLKYLSRQVVKSPSTIARQFISSNYLDSMSKEDKATLGEGTTIVANDIALITTAGGVKVNNAADSKTSRNGRNGFADLLSAAKPVKKKVVSDPFEATIRAAYSKWVRKHGKEANETRFAIYKRHYVMQIEHAKQTGQYFELNKYADLSEEEYYAMQNKGTAAVNAPLPAAKSGPPAIAGSYLDSVSRAVSPKPTNGAEEKTRPFPSSGTYMEFLSSMSPPPVVEPESQSEQYSQTTIDDEGMEAYLDSMEKALAEIEELNKSTDPTPWILNRNDHAESEGILETTTPESVTISSTKEFRDEEAAPGAVLAPVAITSTKAQADLEEVPTEAVIEECSEDSIASPLSSQVSTTPMEKKLGSHKSKINGSIASMVVWVQTKAVLSWMMTRRVSIFSYRLLSIFLVWGTHQTMRVLRLE